MGSIIDVIKHRTSVRSFDGRAPADAEVANLTEFLSTVDGGPFGNAVRFRIVQVRESNTRRLRKLGTYSMIRGATTYLAGAVVRGEMAMEDFGYAMEAVILHATELGRGSCRLAGSLDRSQFAAMIGLRADEVIPAVSPLGRPGGRSSPLVAAAMERHRSHNRAARS